MPRNAGLEAPIFGRKVVHFWRHASPSDIVYEEINLLSGEPQPQSGDPMAGSWVAGSAWQK
jgi:hypothetical protein